MERIYSHYSASISALKKNPTALLKEADGEPIAILNHNKPAAYLLTSEVYEAILERLDDQELASMIRDRSHEKVSAVEVTFDEL